MKLVLKQPQDKLPFIGIQFASMYVASKTNNDLLYLLDGEPCQLILEPLDQYNLNLRLINKQKFIDRTYNRIEYNALRLKSWLDQNQKCKEFNFAHVYLEFDKHVVAKVHFKLFVLKVNSIKTVMEE